jgi:hypothetical protein
MIPSKAAGLQRLPRYHKAHHLQPLNKSGIEVWADDHEDGWVMSLA